MPTRTLPFQLRIEEERGPYKKTITREAVRAIVVHKGKYLMIHNRRGDYKFPGGGMEPRENALEALRREVREETGYTIAPRGLIGEAVERRDDLFEDDARFVMTSRYYLGTLASEKEAQNLDDYEKELRFTPVFVDLEFAIEKTRSVLENGRPINHWVKRELQVMETVKQSETQLHKILRNGKGIL